MFAFCSARGAMRPALILLALATYLATGSAVAREPTSPEAMARAQAQLTARIEAGGFGAIPPLLSSPQDAAMLRTALDPAGLRPVTAATLGEGIASCDAANRYSVTISFIGSRKDEFKNTPPEDATATILKRTTANLTEHQDEMAISLRFSAACMARLVKPAADFWAALPNDQRTPVRLQGLRQIRDGMMGAYMGMVISQGDPGIRESNRLLLIDALLDYNAQLGQGLSPDGRRQVLDTITATIPASSPAARTRLTRLQTELTALPCLELCPL